MRIAVMSDIHGNAIALEAVLADIARQSPDTVCNLGDHFSGPLDPLGTARLLREVGAVSLLGNHDRYLLDDSPEEMSKVDRIASDSLRACDFDWLRALPETTTIPDTLFLCHGTPLADDVHWLDTKDNEGRFFPTPVEQIANDCAEIDVPLICCGHSHVARSVTLNTGQIVFNPGSVGRPAYTMADPVSAGHLSPDAGYALATKTAAGWQVELRQVAYDHMAASAQAFSFGSRGWARHLAEGWQR